MISFALGVYKPYRNIVTVKSKVARLKFSKRVKQSFPVDVILSLEKRTLIMVSLFCGVSLRTAYIIWLGHLNSLFCGVKGLCMAQYFVGSIGFSVVRPKNLEETHFNCGQLKYDYKGGFVNIEIHPGRYGKPESLRNVNRNVISLSSAKELKSTILIKKLEKTKRDFSSKSSHNFKNLKIYKGKYVDLIEVMANVVFLQGAYQKISFNPEVMVKKSGEQTFDGLNSNWFKKTSDRLLDGSFRFVPAKRLMIPKPNKPGRRLLIISNSRDKIIEQAINMVLQYIYEPSFLDTSYGFRFSKGCHSALESIRINWAGISWFLKFDVEKCYNSMNRYRLVSILKEKIDDQRFIDLIFKLFNAGVIG